MAQPDAALEPLLALARWAGTHAWPLFLGVLLSLLVLTSLAWWVAERHSTRALQRGDPRALPEAVRLGAGFLVIVVTASVFAALADALDAARLLVRFDAAFTASLQASVSRDTLLAFAAVTRLGDPLVLTGVGIGVGALLAWQRRHGLLLGWIAAVGGNGLLNDSLKQIFARARPLHDDGLIQASGFSFPSGHSSGAVATYGMLAYVLLHLLPRRHHLPVLLLAVSLALAIGASRAFLRVHHASDVLAGLASGSAWLVVCIASVELARWHRARRSPLPSA